MNKLKGLISPGKDKDSQLLHREQRPIEGDSGHSGKVSGQALHFPENGSSSSPVLIGPNTEPASVTAATDPKNAPGRTIPTEVGSNNGPEIQNFQPIDPPRNTGSSTTTASAAGHATRTSEPVGHRATANTSSSRKEGGSAATAAAAAAASAAWKSHEGDLTNNSTPHVPGEFPCEDNPYWSTDLDPRTDPDPKSSLTTGSMTSAKPATKTDYSGPRRTGNYGGTAGAPPAKVTAHIGRDATIAAGIATGTVALAGRNQKVEKATTVEPTTTSSSTSYPTGSYDIASTGPQPSKDATSTIADDRKDEWRKLYDLTAEAVSTGGPATAQLGQVTRNSDTQGTTKIRVPLWHEAPAQKTAGTAVDDRGSQGVFTAGSERDPKQTSAGLDGYAANEVPKHGKENPGSTDTPLHHATGEKRPTVQETSSTQRHGEAGSNVPETRHDARSVALAGGAGVVGGALYGATRHHQGEASRESTSQDISSKNFIPNTTSTISTEQSTAGSSGVHSAVPSTNQGATSSQPSHYPEESKPHDHRATDTAPTGGLGVTAAYDGGRNLQGYNEPNSEPLRTLGPQHAAYPEQIAHQSSSPQQPQHQPRRKEHPDEDDHTDRNLAAGTVASAGAGVVGYEISKREAEKAEKDYLAEQKAHEKQLAKEQKAAEKAAAKEEKVHEKEVAKEKKAAEKTAAKEEKKHEKEVAKEQKAAEKAAAKEERKHEKELEKEQRAADKAAAKEEKKQEKEAAKQHEATEKEQQKLELAPQEKEAHEKELTEQRETEQKPQKRSTAQEHDIMKGEDKLENHGRAEEDNLEQSQHSTLSTAQEQEQITAEEYDPKAEDEHEKEKKHGFLSRILHRHKDERHDDQPTGQDDGSLTGAEGAGETSTNDNDKNHGRDTLNGHGGHVFGEKHGRHVLHKDPRSGRTSNTTNAADVSAASEHQAE